MVLGNYKSDFKVLFGEINPQHFERYRGNMKTILASLIFCLSLPAFAAKGMAETSKTIDSVVNVFISGKAAEEIFKNLSDRGEVRPGSITKTGADVTCTSVYNMDKKMNVTCTMSIDQRGRVANQHVF